MHYEAILFDLDGTLLPMNMKEYSKQYFLSLTKYLERYNYDANTIINFIYNSYSKILNSDGSKTNEEIFLENFPIDKIVIENFYKTDFQKTKSACSYNPKAVSLIKALKETNTKVILATNPLFPKIATISRLNWAGLKEEDFELITTYENSHFCKPSLSYYQEILSKLNLNKAKALMVGNDVKEDMVAKKLGLDVFLLTDCLENKDNLDISDYHKGNFAALKDFLNL